MQGHWHAHLPRADRPYERTIGHWQMVFIAERGGPTAIHSVEVADLLGILEARVDLVVEDANQESHPVDVGGLHADCAKALFRLCSRLNVNLGRAMATKWPWACFYCGKTRDCKCVGIHGPARSSTGLRKDLLGKPLYAWQQALGEIFGTSNRAQGLAKVADHFGREFDELKKDVGLFLASPTDPAVKLALSFECADILAWLIAVANLRDLDLAYLLQRSLVWELGCAVCRRNPTRCPPSDHPTRVCPFRLSRRGQL